MDRYMELCLYHPELGYYMKKSPLGSDGDFTTAPEICQVFGEVIAAYCVGRWQQLGSPQNFAVLELGPGRGTLMSDFLRAVRVAPEFQPEVHMVEISPTLALAQKEKLSEHGNIKWHTEIPELNKPTILIANEFFDALPIKQFVAGEERLILEEGGNLAFNSPAEDGLVEETCAGLVNISQRLIKFCAAGLIIDYGYTENQKRDTFQALKDHKYHHPLQNPGDADLTAHVNFAELAKHCRQPNQIISQRELLMQFGGDLRAKKLGLEPDFARLVDVNQMGELFKVLCF